MKPAAVHKNRFVIDHFLGAVLRLSAWSVERATADAFIAPDSAWTATDLCPGNPRPGKFVGPFSIALTTFRMAYLKLTTHQRAVDDQKSCTECYRRWVSGKKREAEPDNSNGKSDQHV